MAITCDKCNHHIDKYDLVRLNEKWVKNYLEDYFDKPLSRMNTSGRLGHKDAEWAKLCLYMLYHYCGINYATLARNYHPVKNLPEFVNTIDKTRPDFIYINKDFSSMLPILEEVS